MWATNSKPYDNFCYSLASEHSLIVISVNYQLIPEHRYPSQYDDVFDTLKFIDNTEIEGFSNYANLKQCFLEGDSAGSNLAHHVALKASENKFANIKLIGNISIQPFFGGEERTESELRLNRAPFLNTERTDWHGRRSYRRGQIGTITQPMFSDLILLIFLEFKFPATIVFIGGYDPLQDWQKRYYEGLKKYEKEAYLVEYPNAPHIFYAFPQLPESALLMKEMRDFIRHQLASNI